MGLTPLSRLLQIDEEIPKHVENVSGSDCYYRQKSSAYCTHLGTSLFGLFLRTHHWNFMKCELQFCLRVTTSIVSSET